MKSTLLRITVALAAALFAIMGLAVLVAPIEMSRVAGLDTASLTGLSTLRSDLAGLFLGLALLCAAGAGWKRRTGLVAAATMVGAVTFGRVAGLILDGASAYGLGMLAAELTILAALVAYSRNLNVNPAESAAPRKQARLLAPALGVIALVGLAIAAVSPAFQQALFDRAANDMSARVNTAPLADDALRIAIAGSSAPLPSRSRAKASVVVFAGGKFWVVDSGPESVENLVLWGIPLSQIGGVLLTHFHSDHIGDLGELQLQTWAGGRRAPLAVYGGPGVDRVVDGFNEAYRLDQGYRTAHHGERVMPSAAWGMKAHTVQLVGAPTSAKNRTAVVLDEGGLRITAIEVDHAPIEPAYAYRFDYKGRSVVITGDLKYHPPLARSAHGADVLVSEAISRSMTSSLEKAADSASRARTAAIMHDVQDYHISPEEAAELANRADVRLLAFYHLLPAPDNFLTRRLFAAGVNRVRPQGWTMAEDGSLYTLPLGSKEVRIGTMN